MPKSQTQSGFTLMELSVVLLIVGLLLAGITPRLGSQLEQKQRQHTQQQLEQAKQALLGFAISQGRLPCPASTTSQGLESFCETNSGNCTATSSLQNHGRCSHAHHGLLPVASLGLAETLDGWQRPLFYAVAQNTVNSIDQPFTRPLGIKQAGISPLLNANLLFICYSATGISSSDCGSADNKYSHQIPALIYSAGANPVSSQASETANLDNNRVFVYRAASVNTSDNYDDLLSWLSPHVLFYQMSNAGQLP